MYFTLRVVAIPILLSVFVINNLYTEGFQIILERAGVTYFNNLYVSNGTANVRRFDRKSGYFLTVEGTTKHTWGNNITVHILFYEYVEKEYRRSLLELHLKLCDITSAKAPPMFDFITIAIKRLGLPCPTPPGVYSFRNISIPNANFPGTWPVKRWRTDVTLQLNSNRVDIVKGFVYATFK